MKGDFASGSDIEEEYGTDSKDEDCANFMRTVSEKNNDVASISVDDRYIRRYVILIMSKH